MAKYDDFDLDLRKVKENNLSVSDNRTDTVIDCIKISIEYCSKFTSCLCSESDHTACDRANENNFMVRC